MTSRASNWMWRFGVGLVALAAVAMLVGMAGFAAAQPLPPLLDWVCYLSFFGFWVPGAVGAALIVVSGRRPAAAGTSLSGDVEGK